MRECGPLLIIPPDNTSSSPLLENYLPALSDFLHQSQTRAQLEKWRLNASEREGVRMIQGGRFEIYLSVSGKCCKAFDWIEKTMSKEHQIDNIRSHILSFAVSQARKDPRIASKDFVFDNFSLLVNFDPVKAQLPHLDMVEPNFQFGLIITADSPGTTVYEPVNQIRNMEDVKKHLWKDAPQAVSTLMQSRAQLLLNEYGNVLCPDLRCYYPGLLSCGTLCSIPGSVIHAGPACEKFRAVLFFSASPRDYSAPYHADTQYFAPTICATMVVTLREYLWSQLTFEDRCFLFRKIADARRSYPALANHLTNPTVEHRILRLFLKELRGCKNESELIEWYAASFFEQVSVENLEAEEETNCGVYSKVRVYRRRYNKTCRFYLYWVNYEMWDPEFESQTFTLTMGKSPRKRKSGGGVGSQLFDGENGVLKDNDGDVIRCRMPKI